MPKQTRRSHTKSRTGCLSCKRLRIKCNEAKPRCEYCESTNKVCEYPINQQAYEAPPPKTTRRRNPTKLSTKSEQIEIVSRPANSNSTQTVVTVPPPLKTPTSHVFRNTAYNDIFNFFISTSCNSLAFNNPRILDTWKKVVPRLAFSSPMVFYGLVSYAALTKYKITSFMMRQKQQKAVDNGAILVVPDSVLLGQSNLRNLAFNGFHTLVRLLSKSLSAPLPQKRFEEIHVSSLFVASFAMAEPSVAQLVSTDPYSPDLFGIIRGCFNIPSTVLKIGDGLAERSEIKYIITKPHEIFPSRSDVENIDIEVEWLSFYRMLLRQLELLENGEKGVSPLCGPQNSEEVVKINKQKVKETDQHWPSFKVTAVTSSSSSSLSSPSPMSSPEAQSPSSPLTTPGSTVQTTYETDSDTDVFTLLPHEPAIYRTVIFTFIHLAHLSLRYKRPTTMIQAFNSLPDEFITQLRLDRPFAIVISAFMLAQIEFISRHPMLMDSLAPRLETLEATLPAEWRPALYWPKSIIKRRIYEPGLGKMMSMMGLPMTV